MILKNIYVGHIIILASVSLLSCQRAPDAPPRASSETQTAAPRSEAEVAADTVLWVQLQKDLDSSKLKAGDHFKGEIAEDVIVNGKPVIPKGSTVQGRITNSQQAPSATEAGFLSAVLDGVVVRGTSYQITTSPVTLQGPEAAKNAVVPKKGILQFFLATSVRVKP